MSIEQIKELLSIPFTLPIVAVSMTFVWLIVKSVVDGIARSSENSLRYKFLNKAVDKGALRPEDMQAFLDPTRQKSGLAGKPEEKTFVAAMSVGRTEPPEIEGALSANERLIMQRERALKSGVTLLALAGGLFAGSFLLEYRMLLLGALIAGSIGVGQISYAMARREVIHRIREDVDRSTLS